MRLLRTGRLGLARNLTAGEIVDQVNVAGGDTRPVRKNPDTELSSESQISNGARISNVVFMGMGEPLANYEATLDAVRILNDSAGRHIGIRHLTISTCGLVEGIERLADAGIMQTIPQGVDYIRILPELVLSAFGIVIMLLDPLLDEEGSQKTDHRACGCVGGTRGNLVHVAVSGPYSLRHGARRWLQRVLPLSDRRHLCGRYSYFVRVHGGAAVPRRRILRAHSFRCRIDDSASVCECCPKCARRGPASMRFGSPANMSYHVEYPRIWMVRNTTANRTFWPPDAAWSAGDNRNEECELCQSTKNCMSTPNTLTTRSSRRAGAGMAIIAAMLAIVAGPPAISRPRRSCSHNRRHRTSGLITRPNPCAGINPTWPATFWHNCPARRPRKPWTNTQATWRSTSATARRSRR